MERVDLAPAVSILTRYAKQFGQRVTPQRLAVLEALAQSDGPVTVGELAQRVRGVQPSISLDTVYRSLLLLARLGLATEVNSLGREAARFEFVGTRHHHHHAVCLVCGRSVCIDMARCGVGEALKQAGQEAGFQVVSHVAELYGICGDCQGRGDEGRSADGGASDHRG